MWVTSRSNWSSLSAAVWCIALFAQQGDDVAPKIWTSIRYSSRGSFKLPLHQRNLSASASLRRTLTWWNMTSKPAVNAISSSRKRIRTPIRLLARSGPWYTWSIRETPLNLAAASNTTRLLLGLFTLKTGGCGRYQVIPLFLAAFSGDNFLA